MKKFLSLVLALVMTMSLVTVSAGAKDFTDSSKITYSEAVDVMSAVKVIDGYAEGDFRPTATLTRGAAAKIICNLILGPTTASALVADAAPYKDVPTNHTFAGYIAYCQKEGIISGYADGTFKPAATLTGYAFMKMLLGALGYDSAIEGYTGANWSIAVAKQAINAGLNKSLKGSFNGVKAVTREEACLYAFNTLKATMVEYDNRIVVGEGSSAVAISGVRKDLTWNKGTLNDGKIKKDGYVQFGEQYFEKLVRTDDTDDFGRPTNNWTYDKKDIGNYVNTDLLTASYTAKVKGGDVYSDIGSNACDFALTYWVDGVKLDKKPLSTEADKLVKKNDDTMNSTGKGVLTEIYVDTDAEETTVVVINTYLAEVSADYNTKTEDVRLDVYTGVKKAAAAGQTPTTISAPYTVESEDVDGLEKLKEDDMVLVTIAKGDVMTVTPVETVKDVAITSYSTDYADADKKDEYKLTKLTAGGNKYETAKKAFEDAEVLYDYNVEQLDDATFDLYLDQYGYLIGIEEVNGDDQYVFITAYEKYSSFLTRKLTDANAIFADGTQKTIKVDLKKSFENTDKNDKKIYNGWDAEGDETLNMWFKYTVKDEDTYRLELATKQFRDTEKHDASQDLVKTKTIDSKHPAQKATHVVNATGWVENTGDIKFFYGNADTTYITVSVDELKDAAVIDDVESVTTGIKNVSIDVYNDSMVKDKANTNKADSQGIYTVYDGGYAVASIVIGDDGATSDKFAYLYDEPENERYSKTDKAYYWTMNAVIDGVKTTITFKSDLPYDDNFAENLYKVSYDKDGYATDATVAQHKTDYVWVKEYVEDPTKKDIVKSTFSTGVDLTADGDTLWITDQGKNRGIVLADNCPAVIVEQKLDKGNWVADKTVDYASVAKAIKALDNYDTKNDKVKNFDGTIIVTLKDGIATSVILTDTVEKVDHKKDDTTGKITEAAISKDASGQLVATWTDNKAYANHKYVVDFYLVDGAKEYLKDTVTDISADKATHSEVSSKIAQNGDYYAVIRILDKDSKVVASATTAVKGFAF